MNDLTLFDFKQFKNSSGQFYCSAELPEIDLTVWINQLEAKWFQVWFKITDKGTYFMGSEETLNKALEKLNKVLKTYRERYAKLQENV